MAQLEFPQLLAPEKTAEILGVTPQTLSVWRCTGRYDLPYVKSGRLIRYRLEDINRFIEGRMRKHTGDKSQEMSDSL